MTWIRGNSWYHRALSHSCSNAYQTKSLVGSTEGTTAEEVAQTLCLEWIGTSGHCLKSQLIVLLTTEEYIKVAEPVMFSVVKIEQNFSLNVYY